MTSRAALPSNSSRPPAASRPWPPRSTKSAPRLTAMPKDDRPALGLEHRKVVLADPDDRWAELYRLEERRLRDALGAQALDIQHFGSTSIPGIKAKPVLDIL